MKLFGLFFLSAILFTGCQSRCVGPTMPLSKVGEKGYYIETEILANWYRARDYCRSRGMRLATFNSREENEAVAKLLVAAGLGSKATWIGLNDLGVNNNFVWESTGKPPSYTSWIEGEPNALNADEACVEIRWVTGGVGVWNDVSCTREARNFICEWVPCKNC